MPESAHQLPIRHTPHTKGAIITPRRYQTAIRRKGNTGDPIRVPFEGAHQRTIRHTPQLDGAIPTPPDAINLPSGEKATLLTSPVCPLRVRTNAPSETRHNLMVRSPLPDAIKLPSGEKATLKTISECPLASTRCQGDLAQMRATPSPTPATATSSRSTS